MFVGGVVTDFDGDGMLDLILSHGESMAQPLSVFRGNQVCTHLRALSSQPGVLSVAHEGKEPGLASQHDGKRELESLGPEAHTFPARSTISKRIPCSALCLLPRELLGLKFCPRVIWLPPSCSPHSSPFSRLHQLSSFSPPPSLLLLFPPPCSMPTRLMPTTFLPPGLQQQLVTCGAPHPVWRLRQGCQGCTLHQEEWGAPTDH